MRVLVGLSGGADSAAAALLLREAGHEVVAVYLRLCEQADSRAARHVADALGLSFFEIDARAQFERTVVADFVREYARGRTPNPCALCNREIKTALLLRAADEHGCERLATGHYAALDSEDGRVFLRAGADASREQSYFLWRLTQSQLSRLVFPLAAEHKQALLPRVAPLLAPDTRESREVCFIPEDDRIAYLAAHLPPEAMREGDFLSEDGRVIGRHRGVFRYTVGQRRGLQTGFGERMYVRELSAERATVTLSPRERCLACGARLSELNFQRAATPSDLQEAGELLCRVRYRGRLLPARFEAGENGQGRVLFCAQAREAVAAGQSAVFYDATGAVLGGGVIEAPVWEKECS